MRSGDHIVWGQACGEPTTLVEALIAQAESIGELSAFAATSFSGILSAEAAEKLNLSSMGAIGALRTVAAAGRLGIVPCHVSQIGPMIEQGLIGCDVAFVQVSPPDADGNHSFGLISDFVQAAVTKARVVIAEVNERVPFTLGDAVLPAARIDCAVHVARTPVEVPPAQIGETDQAIARIAAGYIEDGAVLQVGIGATPDAILRLLHDRRDLGVHSGMIGDGLVDLVEAGVVTNALKPIDPGVSITGALIGTRRLYDFADRNPQIGMRSSSYTHNEAVLSRLDRAGDDQFGDGGRFDRTGERRAERQPVSRRHGRPGGLTSAPAAARRAGAPSLRCPRRPRAAKISRIAVALSGPVTTARSDVDVIVTEFGAAELKGQTLAERARRLVEDCASGFSRGAGSAADAIQRRGF